MKSSYLFKSFPSHERSLIGLLYPQDSHHLHLLVIQDLHGSSELIHTPNPLSICSVNSSNFVGIP
ncbi:hypothetical protein PGT21_011580 [Puccinia graminis f. sp. tritici]|uniref:Uncharacterized protein n=1 Tax=Puccinia graminis f. sp. tritici TaxID=56615 RepID=A0A5B0N202_PUCGR|nr:hypothetical protein PGT21_011580 [Puccinia graminis f. sp. tritici]KAA1082130.1 hypothetical protein PGTUg99_022063 [Puccinia graminis f. sp. tritici]KAA1102859.1 hypothetical protein PGTUg99_036714 [Puccinia graminis f. sp. tritici]